MNTFNLYRRDADAEMWREVEVLAQAKKISMSELITEAVELYLREHNPTYNAKFADILRRIERLEGKGPPQTTT
jgi:hypothetical protein